MKHLLIYILLFSALAFQSYGQDTTFYYEDGFVKAQGRFIDGKKEGEWKYRTKVYDRKKRIYKQGPIVAKGNYVNGYKDGVWIEPYLCGYERSYPFFISNELYTITGFIPEYNIDNHGIVPPFFKYLGHYDDSMTIKTVEEIINNDNYYTSKGKYKNGLREGEWVFKNNDGNIMLILNYQNGKLNGYQEEWQYYGNNKKKRVKYSEGYYLNDKRHGKWNYWNMANDFFNNDVFIEGYYSNGLKDSIWYGWYGDFCSLTDKHKNLELKKNKALTINYTQDTLINCEFNAYCFSSPTGANYLTYSSYFYNFKLNKQEGESTHLIRHFFSETPLFMNKDEEVRLDTLIHVETLTKENYSDGVKDAKWSETITEIDFYKKDTTINQYFYNERKTDTSFISTKYNENMVIQHETIYPLDSLNNIDFDTSTFRDFEDGVLKKETITVLGNGRKLNEVTPYSFQSEYFYENGKKVMLKLYYNDRRNSKYYLYKTETFE